MKRLHILTGLLVVLLTVVACTVETGPPDPPPDEEGFSISLSRSTLTVRRGERGTVEVSVERQAGFDGSVELDVNHVPPGVATIISSPGDGNTGTIEFDVQEGTDTGQHDLLVVASSDGLEREAELVLNISSGEGEGGIRGRVQTRNAAIPIDPPSGQGVSALSHVESTQVEPYVPGQLLIRYQTSAVRELAQQDRDVDAFDVLSRDIRAQYGLRVLRQGSEQVAELVALAPGESVKEAAARLSDDPRVAYAEPNYYVQGLSVPDDPHVDRLWNMPVSGLPVAWSLRDSSSTVVAVVDTGIDIDHEDLQGVFLNDGYDFCANEDCTSERSNARPTTSDDRHGTHVTGTLAAIGGNQRGVAGVLHGGASVMPVKVFDSATGQSTADALARGIRWAAGLSVPGVSTNNHPADIINLSLGTTQDSSTVRNAVEAAQDAGVLLVAATGNNGQEGVLYPARYADVLGVGSINSAFERSCFSTFGEGLDIMAAGGDGFICSAPNDEAIFSTLPDDNYGLEAGTSMAAPVVSGAAALVWAQNSGWSASQVAQRLKDTAHFDDDYMTSSRYGAGVLRADVALGFPGPGDQVTVTAEGEDVGDTALDIVRLDLRGSSEAFELLDLQAGSYLLEAATSGHTRNLVGEKTVVVSDGETTSDVRIELERP